MAIKDDRFVFRVTDEERRKIEKNAAPYGLKVGTYARMLLLKGGPPYAEVTLPASRRVPVERLELRPENIRHIPKERRQGAERRHDTKRIA